jgi:hypothetical protein
MEMIADTVVPEGAVHPERVTVRVFPDGETLMVQELNAGML